jgi:hypothetical protein
VAVAFVAPRRLNAWATLLRALMIPQALTSQRRRREFLSQRWPMAHISEYSIVTYERKPGHWRVPYSPKSATGLVRRA